MQLTDVIRNGRFIMDQSVEFDVNSGIGAQSTILTAEGEYNFGGKIWAGRAGGTWKLSTPAQPMTVKDFTESLSNISVGINSFAMAFSIRALVGIGVRLQGRRLCGGAIRRQHPWLTDGSVSMPASDTRRVSRLGHRLADAGVCRGGDQLLPQAAHRSCDRRGGRPYHRGAGHHFHLRTTDPRRMRVTSEEDIKADTTAHNRTRLRLDTIERWHHSPCA